MYKAKIGMLLLAAALVLYFSPQAGAESIEDEPLTIPPQSSEEYPQEDPLPLLPPDPEGGEEDPLPLFPSEGGEEDPLPLQPSEEEEEDPLPLLPPEGEEEDPLPFQPSEGEEDPLPFQPLEGEEVPSPFQPPSSTVGEDVPEDMEEDAGKTAGGRSKLLIVCAACGAAAAAAIIAAIVVVCRRNTPQKREDKASAGLPIRLEIYAGRCKNKSAMLYLSDRLFIGSAADCDIIFEDPEVAARNSCIKLVDGQVFIEDLHSPHGTALDGMRFQAQNRLGSGEVISIGSVEFSVFFQEEPDSAS